MMSLVRILQIGTVIRLTTATCFLLVCYQYNNNNFDGDVTMHFKSIQALLIDPMYSLVIFREYCHLSRMYSNGLVTLASSSIPLDSNFVLMKPIRLLASMDRVMNHLISIITMIPFTVSFIAITIFIDLLTAIQLYRLAKNVISFTTFEHKWEQRLERIMNPRIHPEYSWSLFGKRFGVDFQGDENQRNESVSDNDNTDNDTENNNTNEPICSISDIPQLCCILYYINPITILATSTFPTFQGIQYLLLITAFQLITSAALGSTSKHQEMTLVQKIRPIIKSTFCLALLTNVEFHYIIFLSPLIWCTRNYTIAKNKRSMMQCCVYSFVFWLITIKAILFMYSESEDILSYILNIKLSRIHDSLSPSIGLQWYLYMNLFGRARQFYVVSTKGFPYLFVLPFSIRFYRYPLAMVASFFLLLTLLKQSPTIHDLSMGLVLLLLEPKSLMRMRMSTIISLLAIPVTIVLFVVDYWLWLESGAGNPNYLFFQCLACNLFVSVIVLQFVSSTMKRDKALRLTDTTQKVKIKEM